MADREALQVVVRVRPPNKNEADNEMVPRIVHIVHIHAYTLAFICYHPTNLYLSSQCRLYGRMMRLTR